MANPEEDFSFKQLFIPLTNKKASIIIAIVGLLVFFNILGNGFVWDDTAYILNNTDVHSFSLSKIFGSSYFNKDGYYRPLPALYFTLLYALSAKSAFLYHFVQLMLHIVNTILLFKLFKHFFKKETSLLFSLIFLVHPIIVESVAFIGATISPLFVFFGLCSLQLLIANKPLTPLKYALITFFLFLSLMTKEGGVLFFLIALLYVWLFQRNAFFKLLLYESVVAPVYMVLRIFVAKVHLTAFEASLFGHGTTITDGRYVPIMELSLLERVGMIPSILWYYIKTVFYPVNLAVDQTWVITTLTFQTFSLPLFLSLLFFGSIGFGIWYLRRIKSKEFSTFIFFFVWFLLGIGMHLQLFPLDMTVADRWFYFPFIGLLGMMLVMTEYILSRYNIKQVLLTASFIILLVSIRTIMRNANFANEISLYTHDRLVEDNYEIELNLGSAYGVVGELDKTLYHYQKSVELFPNEANYASLGLFAEWKGKYAEAKEYYKKALTARSFYQNPEKRLSFTYAKLCNTYLLLQEYENAKETCLKGLKAYPKEYDLWLTLAKTEYMLKNHKEALLAAKKAQEIRSDEKTLRLLHVIEKNEPLNLK